MVAVSYFTLMTFLIMLFVILLSMLTILFSTVIVIGQLELASELESDLRDYCGLGQEVAC